MVLNNRISQLLMKALKERSKDIYKEIQKCIISGSMFIAIVQIQRQSNIPQFLYLIRTTNEILLSLSNLFIEIFQHTMYNSVTYIQNKFRKCPQSKSYLHWSARKPIISLRESKEIDWIKIVETILRSYV